MSDTEPRFWDGLGPRLIVIAARLLLVLVILIFVLPRFFSNHALSTLGNFAFQTELSFSTISTQN